MIRTAVHRATLAMIRTAVSLAVGNRARTTSHAERIASFAFVAIGIPDEIEHGVIAGARSHPPMPTGQACVGRQRIVLMQLPHLLGVRKPGRTRHEASEKTVQIIDVANQEPSRVRVPGSINRLRKVNNHRLIAGDEHVVIGQITVDHAHREHADDLPKHPVVDRLRSLGFEGHVPQPWGRIPIGIDNAFHDEDAIDERMGDRHAHAASVKPVNHVHFGGFPLGFILLATVLRTLFQRALIAGVPRFTAFRILRTMLEGALVSVFVDLRHAQLALRLDEKYLRFFSAHQRTDDTFDDAVVEERCQSGWNLHVSAALYSAPGQMGAWKCARLSPERRPKRQLNEPASQGGYRVNHRQRESPSLGVGSCPPPRRFAN